VVVASRGEESEELAVSAEALAERLARRVAALERQLERRIAVADDLRRQLDAVHRELSDARAEVAAARAKGDEYDALMQTATMRVLARPRGWYGAARRLVRPGGAAAS
jgi:chromosome segregation ATPase